MVRWTKRGRDERLATDVWVKRADFKILIVAISALIFLTGFVFGGDVLRMFHGDECLTIPARDMELAQR